MGSHSGAVNWLQGSATIDFRKEIDLSLLNLTNILLKHYHEGRVHHSLVTTLHSASLSLVI